MRSFGDYDVGMVANLYVVAAEAEAGSGGARGSDEQYYRRT